MSRDDLKLEWQTLQREYDDYEKHALYIKISVLFILIFGVGLNIANEILLQIVIVTWVMEAIWKTYQARVECRLLRIEEWFIKEEHKLGVFQYNSEFKKGRGSLSGLLLEYLRSALRPTVAFPYPVLLLIALQA